MGVNVLKLKNALSVAAFAFLGGAGRDIFSQCFSSAGILFANLLGCFLLAFLTYYVIERDLLAGWLDAGLGTGLIGAFTTFSSFATATVKLGQGSVLVAGAYFLASALGGLVMAWLGFVLAKRLAGRAVTTDD